LGVTLNAHIYAAAAPEDLPRDERMDGSTLSFRTLEHNQHCTPLAIEVTDAEGRKLLYVPVRVEGRIVDSRGFTVAGSADELAARVADIASGS
jgi:hypothetical protein